MTKIKIYALSHPITNEVKYIGQTKHTLDERLRGHLKSKENVYRVHWINLLKKDGLKPKIELIEEIDRDVASETEIFWISIFKTWGFKLCNLTDGGETSTTKYIKRDKKWCENISKGKLMSKFKYSDESKKQMSLSAKRRGINSRGEQLSKLKLTDEKVHEIKFYIKNKGKKTLKELSKDLSLPYTFLLDLNNNRIWKHIK
jgi:hypothetical protein